MCLNNNSLRNIDKNNNMSKAHPTVVIHTFFKRLEEPTLDEGYTDPIIDIPYVYVDQTNLEDQWQEI